MRETAQPRSIRPKGLARVRNRRRKVEIRGLETSLHSPSGVLLSCWLELQLQRHSMGALEARRRTREYLHIVHRERGFRSERRANRNKVDMPVRSKKEVLRS